MRKNWHKQGFEDYCNGRVSLVIVLWQAGERDAMHQYGLGRQSAKRQNKIPLYSDGPGANRIKRYYNA